MSHDPTETIRRSEVTRINTEVESSDEDAEQVRLEAEYGQVWNTQQLQKDFVAKSFAAPYIIVERKADNVAGTLEFQHGPRYYFNFKEN